jgi:DNA-binding transcriptional MerR regulator
VGAGRPSRRGDFDTTAAARIVGVPPARLRQCARAGLVTPRHDRHGRLRFGFVDLVLLRTMRGLLDRGVPIRQIGRVLASLRRQIGDRPLTQLRVFADGARVVAWDGSTRWQPESGQFLFNFDAGDVVRKAGNVARLPEPETPKAQQLPRLTADEWADLAVELEPNSPLEARAAYHHALDIDPGHLIARINLGRLLHAEGNLAGAESHYREAVRHEPSSGLSWFNLGVLLEDTRRAEEALSCYETAVRVEAHFADAHYNLALLYEKVGRSREAVRHFSIYRRLSPRGH